MEQEERMTNKSYKSKIESIAGMLAVNKYNIKKGKKVNFEAEKLANETEVRNKIGSIRKELEGKIPGLTLPSTLNHIIADQMLERIDSGITEISQIDRESNLSSTIFERTILPKLDMDDVKQCMDANEKNGIPNAYEYAPLKAMHDFAKDPGKEMDLVSIGLPESMRDLENDYRMYVPKSGSEYNGYGEKVQVVVECPDGSKISVIDSDKPDEKIDQEQAIEVAEIGARGDLIKNLLSQCRDNPEDKALAEDNLKKYDEALRGLGIDAALEDVFEKIESYGIGMFFDEDYQYNMQSFERLLDALQPENANARGLNDDSFAMTWKLGIMSQMFRYAKDNPNDARVTAALGKMQNMEPQLYSILENNPLAFEQLQTVAKSDYPNKVTTMITGTTKSVGKEEYIRQLQQKVEFYKDVPVEPQYATKQVDYATEIKPGWDEERRKRAEREAPKEQPKVPHEELLKRKKKALMDIAKFCGVGKMLEGHFIHFAEKDKDVLGFIEEFFDPKKRGQEGNLLDSLTTEDYEGLKKAITQISIMQNKDKARDLRTESYIQILGNTIANLNRGQVLSADNLGIEDIVQQFSGENGKLIGSGSVTTSDREPEL